MATFTGDTGLVLSEISGGYAANSDEGQQWKFTYSGLWEDVLETAQSLVRYAEFSEAGISGYIQGWDAQTKDGGFGEIEITVGDKVEEEDEEEEEDDSDDEGTDDGTDDETGEEGGGSTIDPDDPVDDGGGESGGEDGSGGGYTDSDGNTWSVSTSVATTDEEISLVEDDSFWKGSNAEDNDDLRRRQFALACAGATILSAGEQSDRLASWKALGESLSINVSEYSSISDWIEGECPEGMLSRILSGNTTTHVSSAVITVDATCDSGGSVSISSLSTPGSLTDTLGEHGCTAHAPDGYQWEIIGDVYTSSEAQNSDGERVYSTTHTTTAKLVKKTTSS